MPHSSSPALRGVLIAAFVFTAIFAVSHSRHAEDFVLETEHLPELLPHQHDAGEAVEDKGHHKYLYSKIITAPRDLWISSMSFDIVNAPDTAVHHAAVLILDEPHQTCKNIPFKEFAGFPQDIMHTPTISFPEGTGMLIRKGERFKLLLMAHNPLPPVGPGGIYHDVFGRLTISLYSEGETAGLKEVLFHLIHLDQTPCKGEYSDRTEAFIFQVPPHTMNYTFSGTSAPDDPAHFTFKKPSTIVYVGGHLHGWQNGKTVVVKKNKKPFLTFITTLSPLYPYRYDSQYYTTHISVDAGDTLSISATYDNIGDVKIRGAMGMLEMYYYEN